MGKARSLGWALITRYGVRCPHKEKRPGRRHSRSGDPARTRGGAGCLDAKERSGRRNPPCPPLDARLPASGWKTRNTSRGRAACGPRGRRQRPSPPSRSHSRGGGCFSADPRRARFGPSLWGSLQKVRLSKGGWLGWVLGAKRLYFPMKSPPSVAPRCRPRWRSACPPRMPRARLPHALRCLSLRGSLLSAQAGRQR